MWYLSWRYEHAKLKKLLYLFINSSRSTDIFNNRLTFEDKTISYWMERPWLWHKLVDIRVNRLSVKRRFDDYIFNFSVIFNNNQTIMQYKINYVVWYVWTYFRCLKISWIWGISFWVLKNLMRLVDRLRKYNGCNWFNLTCSFYNIYAFF